MYHKKRLIVTKNFCIITLSKHACLNGVQCELQSASIAAVIFCLDTMLIIIVLLYFCYFNYKNQTIIMQIMHLFNIICSQSVYNLDKEGQKSNVA